MIILMLKRRKKFLKSKLEGLKEKQKKATTNKPPKNEKIDEILILCSSSLHQKVEWLADNLM